jgi:hypothetical protein
MPILICEDQIRLTGKDANDYFDETGKLNLPITKAEYNRAMQETIEYWKFADCPEAKLLAALLEDKFITT